MEGDNVPPALELLEMGLEEPAKKDKKHALADQEAEVGMTTTVTKNGKGKAVCETCKGDPSDMIHPFYRYSMNLQRKRVYGEQIKNFEVPADTYFWNAKDTAQCFKNKYVLMLG